MTQSRWKSWALWSAILGEIASVLALTGTLERIGLTTEAAEHIIAALGQLLTLFGIVNNPTRADGL